METLLLVGLAGWFGYQTVVENEKALTGFLCVAFLIGAFFSL